MLKKISLNLFDFALPKDLIAQKPLSVKPEAKMLYVGENFIDYQVLDLEHLLQNGDLLIFNDTKVIPAYLIGKKGESKISLNLHTQLDKNHWLCFIKNSKRLKIDDEVIFGEDFKAKIIEKHLNGDVKIYFDDNNFMQKLYKYGNTPLPPYIKREEFLQSDKINYQSIFAKNEGAVAAPTASLHFDSILIEKLKNKGVDFAFITLHVGAGTFLPVKVDNILEHKIHKELGELNQDTINKINKAHQNNKKVIAVGTTVARVLEYSTFKFKELTPFCEEIDLFIYPGFNFKVIDKLLTNFHLPKSTLFMLVSAFCGLDKMQNAYKYAIEKNYRFFSYGDCCLLNKQE